MRIAIASFGLFALLLSGTARAQLAPPPPMQPTPTAPPTAPMWNPFAPQPANQPYGQYAGPSTTQQRLDASEAEGSGRGLEVAWANVEGGGSYASFGSGANEGGPIVGLGVGARFVLFSLGARVRVAPYKDFTLLQVLGEGGFHLPLGMWDPYAKIRAGYGHTSDTSGFDLGGAIGADYYLSSAFSLGLEGGGDVLFFTKTGGAFAGTAHVGLHFDL